MEEKSKEVTYPIRTEGTIKYAIIEVKENEWMVEYESSTDNDVAILSIAQSVCENVVPALSLQAKSIEDTKQRRSIKVLCEKAAAARFGLQMLALHLFPVFKAFKKSIKDEKSA